MNKLAAGLSRLYSVVAMVTLALVPVSAWWAMRYRAPLYGWMAVAALLVLFCAFSGRQVVGFWRGVLIDNRNVISLSRFQIVLWTVIILSAFTMAALFNVFTGIDEPLSIKVPSQVWLLLGISTTSMVGSPLLLGEKAKKPADPKMLGKTVETLEAQGAKAEDIDAVGQVLMNAKPELAQWGDMVTGDETSNGAHLDIGKIQMLFFTLTIAASYAAALWRMFLHPQADGYTQFPALDESTLALLGISHGGYLMNKAVPRQ